MPPNQVGWEAHGTASSFFSWDGSNFLPRLAVNWSPPDLHLPIARITGLSYQDGLLTGLGEGGEEGKEGKKSRWAWVTEDFLNCVYMNSESFVAYTINLKNA
jgi:hypothetical protein